jgi:hypothetical protein
MIGEQCEYIKITTDNVAGDCHHANSIYNLHGVKVMVNNATNIRIYAAQAKREYTKAVGSIASLTGLGNAFNILSLKKLCEQSLKEMERSK